MILSGPLATIPDLYEKNGDRPKLAIRERDEYNLKDTDGCGVVHSAADLHDFSVMLWLSQSKVQTSGLCIAFQETGESRETSRDYFQAHFWLG